jgi:hypothetical protein
MEETIVTDPPKATGQDMLEKQPEELAPGEGADLALSLVVPIAETDQAIAVGDNVLFWEQTSIEIASQIGQRLFTATHLFAMNKPFIRQFFLAVEARQSHGLKPFGSKHTRQVR